AGPSLPWLPWPPEPEVRNAQSEQGDPGSILQLYRRLLAARHASPALRRGGCRLLASPPPVVACERADGDDRRTVLVNFASEPLDVDVDGDWIVEVASPGAGEGEGEGFGGRLPGDAGMILRPGPA
ncbi:MAG: DUF3459 domain-containing protein, partial [Actinobacteria bacterium]|nr:DUF3459 domain-containing protein [Actinomycetota bacterium]